MTVHEEKTNQLVLQLLMHLPMHWTHLPALLKYSPALLLTQQSSALEEGPPTTAVAQSGSVKHPVNWA